MRPALALALLLVTACDKADDADTDDTDLDTDTDVADYPDGVRFAVRHDGEDVTCASVLEDFDTSGSEVLVRDLRFYVSDLVLSGPDGDATLSLVVDGRWQNATTALLDFEDGTGDCAATGNADLNDLVAAGIPEGTWDTLTFSLGVPFEDNHLDVASAEPPLDVPSMFWAWQSGHKFLRFDLTAQGVTQPTDFNTHFGSAGCTSDSSLQAPGTPCARPNVARISIPFDPFADQTVVLDLGALYQAVDLTADTPESPSGCMSAPTDTAECSPLFTALGMEWSTGECVGDCDGQVVFSAE